MVGVVSFTAHLSDQIEEPSLVTAYPLAAPVQPASIVLTLSPSSSAYSVSCFEDDNKPQHVFFCSSFGGIESSESGADDASTSVSNPLIDAFIGNPSISE